MNDEEQALIDMAEQEVTDIDSAVARAAHPPSDWEKTRPWLETQYLPPKLAGYDRFLSKRQFVAGDRLTHVDFRAYEALDSIRIVCPTVFASYSNLIAFMERFESLPKIKEYMSSPKYRRLPIYGPEAAVGGTSQ